MQNSAEKKLAEIEVRIRPLRKQLAEHPLYDKLDSLDDIRVFMSYHVFAVWDFMSLLKALQRELTCVSLPWIPSKNPALARFINEIVLDEETDKTRKGNPASHFEIYKLAMGDVGADRKPIDKFLKKVSKNGGVKDALRESKLHPAVEKFLNHTFSVIDSGEDHRVAAAFTFGREDIIPDMFLSILDLAKAKGKKHKELRYYLERHIELDGDEHGPLSLKMVSELCGNKHMKWQAASDEAVNSLEQRIALWDAIAQEIG